MRQLLLSGMRAGGRHHEEHGLEMVEYALVAAILLGVVAAIVPQISVEFRAAYQAINDALVGAFGG